MTKHCPNPDCSCLEKHDRPAEYQPGTQTCSDCGTGLNEGKGHFDPAELRSSRPLEVLCGQSPARVGALGKAIGDPLVLQKVPGSLSVPVILVVAGLAIIGVSFYHINRTEFIAVLPALLGLGFFFVGLNRLKAYDRRVRRVQLHQLGLSHQLGDQTVAVPYKLIGLATLEAEGISLRGMTIGTLHQLAISCQGKVYTLSSFEPKGMPVHETDRFVLWARKAIERTRAQA